MCLRADTSSIHEIFVSICIGEGFSISVAIWFSTMTWCPIDCWISCRGTFCSIVVILKSKIFPKYMNDSPWAIDGTGWELMNNCGSNWAYIPLRLPAPYVQHLLVWCPFLPTCTRLRRCWWEFEHHGRCSRSPLRRPQIEARRTRYVAFTRSNRSARLSARLSIRQLDERLYGQTVKYNRLER